MENIFEGFRINEKNAIKKIVYKQKADPVNLFDEIIDNLLDEYAYNKIPIQERLLNISSHNRQSIVLSNKCTGFNKDDFNALTTIGGTTKNNSGYYGERGIGLLSALNKDFIDQLSISFYYIPESRFYKISFFWEDEDSLFYSVNEDYPSRDDFTTRYELALSNLYVYKLAIKKIERRLKYQPSPTIYEGNKYKSVFETGNVEFKEANKHIIISKSFTGDFFTILKNYKYIMSFYSIPSLINGGHNKKEDLEEYINGYFYNNCAFYNNPMYFPYVKDIRVTMSSASLSLTLSKEGFYLNDNYYSLLKTLRKAVFQYLDSEYKSLSKDVIFNNLYIFKKQIRQYLNSSEGDELKNEESVFIARLSDEKLFRIFNREKNYSIKQIYHLLKDDKIPVFYSIKGDNLNFASGRFSHKGILTVIPELRYDHFFYDNFLGEIFTEVINLDTLFDHPEKIDELVQKEIVNREDLFPVVRFTKLRSLGKEEKQFVTVLEGFFNCPEVKKIVADNILLNIRKIQVGLFDVLNGDEAVLNASFFDKYGNFLLTSNSCETNFDTLNDSGEWKQDVRDSEKPLDIFVGLNRNSTEYRFLINAYSDQAIEYSLIFVINEIVSTQKFVSRDSAAYYQLRNKLLQQIWKYIITRGN